MLGIQNAEGVGRKLKASARIILTTGMLAVGVAVTEGCNDYTDGDGPPVSAATAKQKALYQYERAFKEASPAGKFLLQYLSTADVHFDEDTDKKGSATPSWDNLYLFKINNACLKGTVYDIGNTFDTSSSSVTSLLKANGLSSEDSTVQKAQAAPYWDPGSPNVLKISPDHPNAQILRFTGVEHGDGLRPADHQTKDILATFRCQTGVVGYTPDYYIP